MRIGVDAVIMGMMEHARTPSKRGECVSAQCQARSKQKAFRRSEMLQLQLDLLSTKPLRQPKPAKAKRGTGASATLASNSSPKNKRAAGVLITPDNAAAEMAKGLLRLTATGRGVREAFADLLELSNLLLDALPSFWNAAAQGTQIVPSDEIETRYAGVMARYGGEKDWVIKEFGNLFCILLLASEDETGAPSYRDVLGQVYMELISHGHNGEYYTPHAIARMMAQMHGPADELCEHLRAAVRQSQCGKFFDALGIDVSGWEFDALLGLYDLYDDVRAQYQPVTVSDPACGSGIMFLACAAECPRAAVVRGLVTFHGADISQMAAAMCKLNFRLYSINGMGYRWS